MMQLFNECELTDQLR